MRKQSISRPIGLTAFCDKVEQTCADARIYKHCGFRPDHLVLALDAGSGRTTALSYLCDMYRAHGVMDFADAQDECLEFVLEGTLAQLKEVFCDIDAAAVYDNHYGNVVGMDVSAIARHMNELQLPQLLEGLKRVGEHACLVLFFPTSMDAQQQRLCHLLKDALGRVCSLETGPYTQAELLQLLRKAVEARGVVLCSDAQMNRELERLCSDMQVQNVKAAEDLARQIVFAADFSGFTPVADAQCLAKLHDAADEKGAWY